MILAENLRQTPEATTIWMDFAMTPIQAAKLDPKNRKRTDCRRRSRELIAPDNAITPRVQPLYESCGVYVGRRQALKLGTSRREPREGAKHSCDNIKLRVI